MYLSSVVSMKQYKNNLNLKVNNVTVKHDNPSLTNNDIQIITNLVCNNLFYMKAYT